MTALDPLLSLSFSVHSNPGVYAVLLGSGVSRSASIPTGWEVVLDLVRKVAALEGADCGADPAAWYAGRFGEDPDYAKLLKVVGKRPAERQSLLRGYFEATDDERTAGLKQPTKAHRAIAALVQSGHVRVIVTTNFDRLMEQSLEAVGISPTVISTPDAADGAVPLAHARCTIIKVHGDYLDTRIKNTPEELAKYDRRMNKLLDRVLDEYGLIVSGWSADWDEALRAAVERCKSQRFTTCWAARDTLTDPAQRLVQLRAASVVPGLDADAFFAGVQQKVEALAAFNRPHPLSVATAVATTKRFLSDARRSIDLHELVFAEVEKVIEATNDQRMPCSSDAVRWNQGEARQRIEEYDAATELLAAVMATGCYWGEERYCPLWVHALSRIGSKEILSGLTNYINLRIYPATYLLYASGIASIAGNKYATLKALLLDTRVRKSDKEEPTVEVLYPTSALDERDGQVVLARPKQALPLNEHMFERLRDPLRGYLPDDKKYEEAFERFEYLLALACVDQQLLRGQSHYVAIPFGRFMWHRRWYGNGAAYIAETIRAERASQDEAWAPIRAGLIGTRERFDAADRAISERLAKIHPF